MNGPHVCLRSSRKLLRWQCQRRSSGFVSIRQLVGRDDDSKISPQEVSLVNGDPTAVRKPRRKKRLTFAPYQEQRKPKGVDKVLEALFASNRENDQALHRSRYSRTPKVQSVKSAAIERLEIERSRDDRLREVHNKLLRGTAPLQEIWRDCQILLSEKSWRPKDNVIEDAGSGELLAFRDVLVAICQKQPLEIYGRNFTPADAINIYRKHGAMRYWWDLVLWCQLGQVLELRYQSTDETQEAASNIRIRSLMDETLEVWRSYKDMYGLHHESVSVSLSQDSHELADEASTSEPVSSSLPEQKISKKRPNDTTVAAAMTLDCLKAAGLNAPLQIRSLFDRFRRTVERDRSIATRNLLRAGVSSEVTEKALEGWECLTSPDPEQILESTKQPKKSPVSKYPMDASEMSHHLDWGEKGLPQRFADIDGASNRLDTASAINLWHQFQAHIQADKTEDKTDSDDQLYVRFLRTFWALRRHGYAIEVWNHMINSGYVPTQLHWNAMLAGCFRAKDVESLQTIWTNMLRSGSPADTRTWTTYIHGLIDCHKWEEGLSALESLGRIWKSAPPLTPPHTVDDKMTGTNTAEEEQTTEKPEGTAVLRPALSPINAALSALIHINKRSLLPRVLAWARSHRITFTTKTFNILLRPIVRHGSQASIQAHLQQMADANCTPDIGTFSIILNGLVSNPTSTFHTLPPETQESTIMSILADMGRQGIEPNEFTYGTLLDGVLTPGSRELSHDYTPNVPAARTILADMAARNIYPTSPVYTILITYYFTRRPFPDLPAISSLWSSIRHTGQTSNMDNIFFDRLIEGYADNDEIEQSLMFLRMVPEYGKSPSWWALVKVLRALVRGKEWGLCVELVEDVQREGGLMRFGEGRGRGQSQTEFWELVNILKERGVVGSESSEER